MPGHPPPNSMPSEPIPNVSENGGLIHGLFDAREADADFLLHTTSPTAASPIGYHYEPPKNGLCIIPQPLQRPKYRNIFGDIRGHLLEQASGMFYALLGHASTFCYLPFAFIDYVTVFSDHFFAASLTSSIAIHKHFF